MDILTENYKLYLGDCLEVTSYRINAFSDNYLEEIILIKK